MMIHTFDYRRSLFEIEEEVQHAIQRVIGSGCLLLGPETEAFESEFAAFMGTKHCIGVSSGTAALLLSLLALDIGPGDEVITVANTCPPTISAIRSCGATPVFVDVHSDTLMMDVEQVSRAITSKTKCIIPVHLWGNAVPMQAVMELADANNIPVVEDCAQAHATEIDSQYAGTIGTTGCFSFYPTKNIGAYGDAGGIVTNDDCLAMKLRRIRTYGFDDKAQVITDGTNARISELQAAILRVKLSVYPSWLDRRRGVAATYDEHIDIPSVTTPATTPGVRHGYHQYVLLCADRAAVINQLKNHAIGFGIHYPTPMHHMPAYKQFSHHALPVTEKAATQVLSLPVHESLSLHESLQVVKVINDFEIKDSTAKIAA